MKRSGVSGNRESFGKAGIGRSVFFLYVANTGKARAAFEDGAQLRELLRGSGCKNFHAAIAQISYVATQMQFLRSTLRKIAKTHTLHGAGYEVPLDLECIAHETRNCSRDPRVFAEVAFAVVREWQQSWAKAFCIARGD
jgi:hypothetical protein